MDKSDYISIISDNVKIFGINLLNELEGNKFNTYLNKFDVNFLSVIAEFNRIFLEHFIKISKGNNQKDLELILKKMEKIASFIGPTGSLNNLNNNQVEIILTKLNSLSLNEITPDKIAKIADIAIIFGINLPNELHGTKSNNYKFDDKILSRIAGFNNIFLEYFIIISKGKDKKDLELILKKLEKIAYFINPTGILHYLNDNQVELILTKLNSLSLDEITQERIAIIAVEQLLQQLSGSQHDQNHILENRLSTAAFYLIEMGYPQHEIQDIINNARKDLSKIDSIFNLSRREETPLSPTPNSSQGRPPIGDPQRQSREAVLIENTPEMEQVIRRYVQQVQHKQNPQRAQKAATIIGKIKNLVGDLMTDYYEQVFQQVHPDRLNRAFEMMKESKRKSKRVSLLLEWVFFSHLIENIEIKVKHWQVSSDTKQGRAGGYFSRISFSRYDHIIKNFADRKLSRTINILRRFIVYL